jgi:cytoskeletal protein CcmA (bactofilin family)
MTRTAVTLAVVLLVTLAVVPGVAAAATRTGGSVVVGADETIDENLDAFGGSVVVRGTVEGDLNAFAGTVVVQGTVEGDVMAVGGTVQILGTVGGDVEASGGTVDVGEGATVGGTLAAAGGTVAVAGSVDGDARLAGETVTLAETAVLGGELEYDGELVRADGATVEGAVTQNTGIEVGPAPELTVPSGVFAVYGAIVTLLVGAFLLLVFPVFSADVARQVATEPLRTAGAGLLTTIAVPVALGLVAITIVGIPLSLAGSVAFGLLVWVGTVYGRYALGAWLLGLADTENRWLALIVGVVVVAVLSFVPIVDPLVRFAVFLLGFGALVRGLLRTYTDRRGERRTTEPTAPTPPESDSDVGAT